MTDTGFYSEGANGASEYQGMDVQQVVGDGPHGDKINSSKSDDDERKIFVGGLSWETTVKDLREYFEKYGPVLDCTLKTDPTTGRSRGFGFVLFGESGTVDRVLEEKAHLLHGRNIDPKRAKARGGREPILKIFVGGLDPSVPEADVRQYFEQYGKVTDIDLPFDKTKNQRRAFCFVSFDSEETVDRACEMAKQDVCGKKVDVKKATPKDQQGGWGGRGGRGGFRGGFRGGRGGYGQGWGGNQGYGTGYDYNQGYGYDYSQGYGQGYGQGGYDYNSYYGNQGWGGNYNNYSQGGDNSGWDYGNNQQDYYGSQTDSTAEPSSNEFKAKRGGTNSTGYHPYSR